MLLKNEIQRKGIHTGALLIPLGYHFLLDQRSILILSGMLLVIAVGIEWLRLHYPSVNDLFRKRVGAMLRENEHHQITAATWMAAAMFVSFFLFEKPVAVFVTMSTIAGDAAASLIGLHFGQIRIGTKTLEGSLAFFLITLLLGFVLSDLPLWIWLSGGLILTITELLPLSVNDNLRLPFIAGPVMEILVWFNR